MISVCLQLSKGIGGHSASSGATAKTGRVREPILEPITISNKNDKQ